MKGRLTRLLFTAFALCLCAWVSAQDLHVKSPLIENGPVHAFMTEVAYREGDFTYSSIAAYTGMRTDTRADLPAPAVIGWTPQKGQSRIVVSDGESFSKSYAVDSTCAEMRIYNLIPGKKYRVRLEGDVDSTQIDLVPQGQLRMIYILSSRNVRDLGGWESELFRHDDGTPMKIRYGRLFRGAELDRKRTLSDADRDIFRSELKIGADLDLRGDKEARRAVQSPLGADVDYFRLPTSAYSSAATNGSQAQDFRWLLMRLKEGKRVYFHCAHGADRTGTLAFIIEALLGVSESDIAKDYELTSFYGRRSREAGNNYDFGNMILSFYEQFGEPTLTGCVEAYLKSYGTSQSEIDEFRELMLE